MIQKRIFLDFLPCLHLLIGNVPCKTPNDSVSFFDCSAPLSQSFLMNLKWQRLEKSSQQFPARCNFPWLVGMHGKLRRTTELTNQDRMTVSYVNEVSRNFQQRSVQIVVKGDQVCGGMMLFKVGSLGCNSSWEKFLCSVMNVDCLRARMFV